MEKNKKQNVQSSTLKKEKKLADPKASAQMDQLSREADKERSRKPGSQSNSSDRHNSGRGGGK